MKVFKVKTAGIRQQEMAKLPPLQDLCASHVGSLPEPDLKCGHDLPTVPLKEVGHQYWASSVPGSPGECGSPSNTALSSRSSVPPK